MTEKTEMVVEIDTAMADSCPELAAGMVMTRILDQFLPTDLQAQFRIVQWLYQKTAWDLHQVEQAQRGVKH